MCSNILFSCVALTHDDLTTHFFVLCDGNPVATGGFPSQRASNQMQYISLLA